MGELYQKMSKFVPTAMAKDKSPEDYKEFWTGNDPNTHSKLQGLLVYLSQFSSYMVTCGAGADKFTSTGTTIGEIKLFATLTLLVDPEVALPSNLVAFMERFNGNAKVRTVL